MSVDNLNLDLNVDPWHVETKFWILSETFDLRRELVSALKWDINQESWHAETQFWKSVEMVDPFWV